MPIYNIKLIERCEYTYIFNAPNKNVAINLAVSQFNQQKPDAKDAHLTDAKWLDKSAEEIKIAEIVKS